MAKLYREIGKRVFAICDKQDAANKALIEAQVDVLLMHDEKGFEDLVLKNTTEEALKRFAKLVDWPPHLTADRKRVGQGKRVSVRVVLGGRRLIKKHI